MVIYFDTSSMLKFFVDEKGSEKVNNYVSKADEIIVSPITDLEVHSAIRRLLLEKYIDNVRYEKLKNQIEEVFTDFEVISFSNNLKHIANEVIEKYQLKALDAIQLAASKQHNCFDYFMCCDKKLIKAAESEGLKVINPMD